jgi:hypothetical protein
MVKASQTADQNSDPKTTGENGDGSVNPTDLLPGEYTCTVVVDP